MASTAITFTDSHNRYFGPDLVLRSAGFYGEDSYDLSGFGARIDFQVAPCESLVLRLRGDGGGTATPINVSINGSVTTPTITMDGTFRNVTIYNSTSATIRGFIQANSSATVLISKDAFLAATHSSSTPAVAAPPDMLYVYKLVDTASIRREDVGLIHSTFVGFPGYDVRNNDAKLTFKGGSPGDLRLFLWRNGSGQVRVAKNGTYSGSPTTIPSASLFGVLSVASGLTGSVGDVWTVHFSGQPTSEGGLSGEVGYLIVDTAIDTVDWTSPVRRKVMVEGTSIDEVTRALSTDSSNGMIDPAGLLANVTVFNRGIYGSTISTTNGSNALVSRIAADVTAATPTELDIDMGTNDLQFGTAEATVKADLKTAVGNAIGAYAGLTIIRIHAVAPRGDTYESGRASFNTNVLQAAATELQASNPTKTITYTTDIAASITNTATDLNASDHVHFTLTGYGKAAPALAATWGYVAVPPYYGNQGLALLGVG